MTTPIEELRKVVEAGTQPPGHDDDIVCAGRILRFLTSESAAEELARGVCAFDCDDPDILLGDGYPQWFGNRPLVVALLNLIAKHGLKS